MRDAVVQKCMDIWVHVIVKYTPCTSSKRDRVYLLGAGFVQYIMEIWILKLGIYERLTHETKKNAAYYLEGHT